MKIQTRRLIGIGLIVVAVVTGVVLQLVGTDVFLFRSEGGTLPTQMEFGFHWSALVLLLVAFAGLLCLLLPSRHQGHPQASRPFDRDSP